MNIEDIELKKIKGIIAREEAIHLYQPARESSIIGLRYNTISNH